MVKKKKISKFCLFPTFVFTKTFYKTKATKKLNLNTMENLYLLKEKQTKLGGITGMEIFQRTIH